MSGEDTSTQFNATETAGAMEPNRIYCAEQIVPHPELHGILKDFTKAAIRAKPEDLVKWSLNYFKKKSEEVTLAQASS